MSLRNARWVAGVVMAASLTGTAVLGQPPFPAQPAPADPLAAARTGQSIADQKAISVVDSAIDSANRIAKTNSAKAAQVLRAAQSDIDSSGAISGSTRKTLTDQLQTRLAQIEGRPLPNSSAKLDPTGVAVKMARKDGLETYEAEVREVRDGLDAVKKLQEANRTAEAARVAAGLAARYPNNPAVITLTQKDGFGKNITESRLMSRMQSERVLLAQNSVIRSSMPPKGDIEFPADWKERTKNRSTEVQLTAKEKKVIESLDRPVTLAIKDQPLEYALQELSNQMGQPIAIDTKSLTDQGTDLKRLTSAEMKGVSARTALRQLLGGVGLTFVVKEETIQVMTVDRARDTLVTRVYYLGDLVQGVGPFGGALRWGPFLDYQQTVANVEVLIDSIKSSVDPESWRGKGGAGTITFHFPSMSLVVRASSEVHASLGSKLGRR
jgi:hypothetical protein